MFSFRVAKHKLQTQVESTKKQIKELALGDEVWVTEGKTGLLVKVVIVHEFHVPGLYVEQTKKYEKDSSKVVWAKQDLGGSRFRWFALYADAEIDNAPDGVLEKDKYFNFYHPQNLYKNSDNTSSLEPIKLTVPWTPK